MFIATQRMPGSDGSKAAPDTSPSSLASRSVNASTASTTVISAAPGHVSVTSPGHAFAAPQVAVGVSTYETVPNSTHRLYDAWPSSYQVWPTMLAPSPARRIVSASTLSSPVRSCAT